MDKNIIIIAGTSIIAIIILITLIILFINNKKMSNGIEEELEEKQNKEYTKTNTYFIENKEELEKLEYNLKIEVHSKIQRTTHSVDEKEQATYYTYKLINTNKKELYTITYNDIWSVNNRRGELDKLKVEVSNITDIDLENSIKKYEVIESDKVINLLNNYIKEEYEIIKK